MKKINCTEEFKTRCKEMYPDWGELHNFLVSEVSHENLQVGKCLETGVFVAEKEINYITVLAATSLEELQAKANIVVERKALLTEWLKLKKSVEQ